MLNYLLSAPATTGLCSLFVPTATIEQNSCFFVLIRKAYVVIVKVGIIFQC